MSRRKKSWNRKSSVRSNFELHSKNEKDANVKKLKNDEKRKRRKRNT